jgi:HSP20 family molecular chaperone IbpA
MSQNNEFVRSEQEEVIAPELPHPSAHYIPRVDIYETTDEMVVLCDMPGVKPGNVDVQFERGKLTVTGRVANRSMSGRLLEQEYGIGDYSRTFAIAPEVETEQISAECCDGVLTLHLPKKESAKPKRITVVHAE